MKYLLYSLTIVALIMVSCQDESAVTKTIAVSGHIENAKGDSIVFEQHGSVHKLAVDDQGYFRGGFEGLSGYYNLSYGRQYSSCYLSPSDDTLGISFDLTQFDETMKYEGAHSDPNNYLAAKFLLTEEQGKTLGMRDMYSLSVDSFSQVLESHKSAVLELLSNSALSSDFTTLEGKNVDYEYLGKARNYEAYHKYFTKKDSVALTEDFQQQFENIDYTIEEDFNAIPQYRSMVLNHFTNDKLHECLDKLQDVQSSSIKDAVIVRLNDWLSPGAENIDSMVGLMQSMVSNNDLVQDIQENFDSMKSITKGNVSPGFEFKNIDNQMVNLDDLKGKNVYIDVWATWCGPCKAEIPHLKTLESDYHGKDIEFVSISVDVPNDEQKWKDMVADKELKGIQLMSDNGWNTSFVESYLIKGIPRFILLDANGNIVSADAPRPSSDDEIRGMIDKLLIKA